MRYKIRLATLADVATIAHHRVAMFTDMGPMRKVIPFPLTNSAGSMRVGDGRQAIVVNVYTEPTHRRRGLARLLMDEVIQWARDMRVESLVLHAAPDGRPLYDQLGFQSTNEMRYMRDL